MTTLLWNQCLACLERELSGSDFNTWIRPLYALEDVNTLRLLAPNRFVLEWVRQHFQQRIQRLLTRFKPTQPPVLILQIGSRKQSISSPDQPVQTSLALPPTYTNHLNPKMTFASFIPGQSNQLARATSLQVAEQGEYNPLFIYGGVGLGKTHLMQAVGHQIIAHKPDAKVMYLHSERFVNDMIKALRDKKMSDFKRQYRSLDALLIDDVQFFANKTQSQEELFHTMNALLECKKQIILTGNSTPQTMTGLEDRLKSRFSWGVAVTVIKPDFETRLAILLDKAKQVQIPLPYEVGCYIAKHIQSNVRELEGALNRLTATARVMRQAITLDSAQDALQDLLTIQTPIVTLQAIQALVADYFRIPVTELSAKGRQKIIARPRQIAMSLAKELTSHSLLEIADAFRRDHSTVLYSCKTIAKLKATDEQVNQDYLNLRKQLSA